MEKITIIIPVHEFNKEVKTYLTKAIESVYVQEKLDFEIVMVGHGEIMSDLNKNYNDEKITLLTNTGNSEYCEQINFAVKNINTKYFSILAFDDVYSGTWFKNVEKYIKNMPEYSIFLPIVNFKDTENKEIGAVNEIIWSMSFADEMGVIDENILQSYHDFSPNGGVFRTDDFVEVGMLKPSIKLSFWYEFLLRAANQSLKIFVIPKNGYLQTIGREGSILNLIDKSMDEDERTWWVELAGKEYYFKQERKEKYVYTAKKDFEDLK